MSAPVPDDRAFPLGRLASGATVVGTVVEHSDVTLRAAIVDDDAGADLAAQATDGSRWQ